MLIPAAAYRRGLQKSDPSPYYNPAIQKANAFQNFLDVGSEVNDYNQNDASVDPQYDWASKALQTGVQANQLVGQSAQNAINNQLAIQQQKMNNLQNNGMVVNPSAATGGGGQLGAVLRALGIQESGGNFGAVNKGSGALGKWQVMPGNVPSWSKQALGHSVSTNQFLTSPKAQRAIVRYIFGGYLKKYGVKGALSTWYSGNPNRYKDSSSVKGGPSVADYVNQVLSHMQ